MDWEAFYARFREPNFIPGYEIQNRLGGGAFGEVYKARKASIGKAYAIKFLRLDDEAQRDAALREFEQVRHFAAIDHPNLVTIEDMGTAMGVPYLIMGYAGEDTLARRMRAGDLDPVDALAIFVQVCRGVVALHDRRLVHFDLKPSNIFLKGDVARVGDYGLSKMLVDGRLTLSFGRGTPHYMAPEMLRNRADHRADVYSLGVILYECLAKKLPFESPVPGTIHVRETDEPPPFPDEVPPRLREVVSRCLRLAPADRHASVADLLSDLGASARPLDSVRLPTTPLAPRESAPAGSIAPAQSDDSDMRQTAAELARGAALVARGVWDGLRSAPVDRTPTPPRAARPPTPTPAVAASPAATPREPVRALAAAAPASSGGEGRSANEAFDELPRDVVAMHGLSDVPLARPSSSTPVFAAATATAAGAVTIPVPPASSEGLFRSIVEAVELAMQVFASIVRGTVGFALKLVSSRRARSAPRAAGGAVRRGVSFVGGVLRLVLFLVLLAALGGLTTLVAVSFLS